jgi:hypothetical protein
MDPGDQQVVNPSLLERVVYLLAVVRNSILRCNGNGSMLTGPRPVLGTRRLIIATTIRGVYR